jgi:hypothetical protein
VVEGVVDPATLIGDHLTSVTVGWHVHNDARQAVEYFLRLASGVEVKVHTAGDRSLVLLRASPPADFDMQNYGRFEFRDLVRDSPLAAALGRQLTAVDRICWRDTVVGLRLRAGEVTAVLANEGDEVFVSAGDLPPDYEGASVEETRS